MPLSKRANTIVRIATTVILAAFTVSPAWAQQAYDTANRYELNSDLDALPSSLRRFDYSLSPEVAEYGWLRNNDEHAPDRRESVGGLGLGWDVQPSGGLFGAWSDVGEDRENDHEFTMGPSFGEGGLLPPGLEYLVEDDNESFSVDPPSITFDDEPLEDDSDSDLEFEVDYSFGDPFQLRLRYEYEADASDGADEPEEYGLRYWDRFQGDASVSIDPPTLDLDAPPSEPVESVIPYLSPLLPYSSGSEPESNGGSEPQTETQPLPGTRPSWQVESDHRVALTRRWIEDNYRGAFYDARIAHAEGTGTIEEVEEAYRQLSERYH